MGTPRLERPERPTGDRGPTSRSRGNGGRGSTGGRRSSRSDRGSRGARSSRCRSRASTASFQSTGTRGRRLGSVPSSSIFPRRPARRRPARPGVGRQARLDSGPEAQGQPEIDPVRLFSSSVSRNQSFGSASAPQAGRRRRAGPPDEEPLVGKRPVVRVGERRGEAAISSSRVERPSQSCLSNVGAIGVVAAGREPLDRSRWSREAVPDLRADRRSELFDGAPPGFASSSRTPARRPVDAAGRTSPAATSTVAAIRPKTTLPSRHELRVRDDGQPLSGFRSTAAVEDVRRGLPGVHGTEMTRPRLDADSLGAAPPFGPDRRPGSRTDRRRSVRLLGSVACTYVNKRKPQVTIVKDFEGTDRDRPELGDAVRGRSPARRYGLVR